MGAKGAKRSVKMCTTNFYKIFFKNILLYMNGRLSKIRSVHTYAISRTVYFGWICKSLTLVQLFFGAYFLTYRWQHERKPSHACLWEKPDFYWLLMTSHFEGLGARFRNYCLVYDGFLGNGNYCTIILYVTVIRNAKSTKENCP